MGETIKRSEALDDEKKSLWEKFGGENKKIIDENYDKPISLEEISDRFGLSSEYFSRLFTQKIGIPFKKHLNQVRLSHIYHDLCSSDAPIMEIVDRHGFTNYKLFNRMFKEIYGATPREVRRRISMMN